MTMNELIPLVTKEMQWAYEKHGPYHNAHEQYAVMQEEVDEWWQAVKGNYSDSALYELIQVAAVALRYVIEKEDWQDLAWIQDQRHKESK